MFHGFWSAAQSIGITELYSSHDSGASWQHVSTARGQYWSNLFMEGGAVYLLGTSSARSAPLPLDPPYTLYPHRAVSYKANHGWFRTEIGSMRMWTSMWLRL